MRKIKQIEWKDPGIPPNASEELIEQLRKSAPAKDTTDMIKLLLNMIPREQEPKGIKNMTQLFGIMQSLREAKGNEYIYLEEDEWKFLSDQTFKHMSARFAMSEEIYPVILAITNCEMYTVKAKKKRPTELEAQPELVKEMERPDPESK